MHIELHGAAGQVTGSLHLLRVGGSTVLLDCGMVQGERDADVQNRRRFPVDVGEIDAVVVSHAHIDHSGRLPLLVRQGYSGPVYATQATCDLLAIMLRDAAYLQEREAEWEARRHGDDADPPLYTTEDAEAALRRLEPVAYDETFDVAPGVRVRLRDAGHILGSAIVELWCEESGRETKVVFSGDLGHGGVPILRDPTPVDEADVVLMEATYGDRVHRGRQETIEELGAILEDARARAGNVVIPAFAVGRTQDLLVTLAEHADDWGLSRWRIVLDSPMAIEATRVYRQHPELFDEETRALVARTGGAFLPNLELSKEASDSIALNDVGHGMIVIAASGMCTGGRIKHHLRRNLPREGSHVIFVGYQAMGTPGRRLVDGADSLVIFGEEVPVEAQVHTVGGLSAHADQAELVAWAKGFAGSPRFVLVHGEPTGLSGLRDVLVGEGRNVVIGEVGMRIEL